MKKSSGDERNHPPQARRDLRNGFDFYEEQAPGLGTRFLQSIYLDIDRLKTLAGIHARDYSFQRMIAKKFPFGIFYEVESQIVNVYAVIDLRRDPEWIAARLR